MKDDAAVVEAPPPLLNRLASAISSLLGSSGSHPSDDDNDDGNQDSSSISTSTSTSRRQPVPAVPIDARWLGDEANSDLPRELLFCILSFLPLESLGAFAAAGRGYWSLLAVEGEGRAAWDAQELYRCVCVVCVCGGESCCWISIDSGMICSVGFVLIDRVEAS